MDEALKLVSLTFTGLGIFAGAFAPVFPSYTAILAATAAGCGGVSALCQKTLSGATSAVLQPAIVAVDPGPATPPRPTPQPAPAPTTPRPPVG